MTWFVIRKLPPAQVASLRVLAKVWMLLWALILGVALPPLGIAVAVLVILNWVRRPRRPRTSDHLPFYA